MKSRKPAITCGRHVPTKAYGGGSTATAFPAANSKKTFMGSVELQKSGSTEGSLPASIATLVGKGHCPFTIPVEASRARMLALRLSFIFDDLYVCKKVLNARRDNETKR
jgi:hypothetical protein